MTNLITNENKFPTAFENLVQDIEHDINNLIRKKIIQCHNENSTGMKFNYKNNDLDIAINQYVLKNGFNNSIEQVLTEIDTLKEYY